MKVILSRKGFDSSYGGIPSAIMPDNGLVSFPIPRRTETYLSNLHYEGMSYKELHADLAGWYGDMSCHLDPDLDCSRHGLAKGKKFVAAFGQSGPALKVLQDAGVGEGDLFLFFGWFRHVAKGDDGIYHYVRRSRSYEGNDLHLIWGYLQVDKILKTADEIRKTVPWHPHAQEDFIKMKKRENQDNWVFLARKNLSFAPSQSGAKILPYETKRVLTMEGACRSTWKHDKVIPNMVKGGRRCVQSDVGICYPGIWQELVLAENKTVENWAKLLITENNR